MSAITAEQMIEAAHVWLMSQADTVAYSSVLMVGETRVVDDISTAATNGRDVFYGREFIESLTKPQLRAVVLHENLHKVYQHGWLWKNLFRENPKLANATADYVINLDIEELRIKTNGAIALPDGVLLDKAYKGMSTHEVYELLKKQGDNDDAGKTLDEHDFGTLTEEEIKQVAEEVDTALRQGALAAGKLGGNVSRSLAALLEPKIDWKEQLRDFMVTVGSGRDDSTWRRPNRRWIQHDIYMPSSISASVGRIVFACDTSGSVTDADVATAVTELASICQTVKPEMIDVIWWDAAVCGHEVYQRDDLESAVHRTRPKGGGGTSAQCVSEYLSKNNITPECVIMLSDGYIPHGEWGEWNCPVLWVLTTKHITAPCGVTIHLDR